MDIRPQRVEHADVVVVLEQLGQHGLTDETRAAGQ
jgi:hypothetical protein